MSFDSEPYKSILDHYLDYLSSEGIREYNNPAIYWLPDQSEEAFERYLGGDPDLCTPVHGDPAAEDLSYEEVEGDLAVASDEFMVFYVGDEGYDPLESSEGDIYIVAGHEEELNHPVIREWEGDEFDYVAPEGLISRQLS